MIYTRNYVCIYSMYVYCLHSLNVSFYLLWCMYRIHYIIYHVLISDYFHQVMWERFLVGRWGLRGCLSSHRSRQRWGGNFAFGPALLHCPSGLSLSSLPGEVFGYATSPCASRRCDSPARSLTVPLLLIRLKWIQIWPLDTWHINDGLYMTTLGIYQLGLCIMLFFYCLFC